MARFKRQIVKIDEDLCDGCGDCVPACAEGAIQIIDGKAKLIGENLCDGLGACLGNCPQGAIIIEEREADEYDEEAVERHLAGQNEEPDPVKTVEPQACPGPMPHMGGCPGSRTQVFADPPNDYSEKVEDFRMPQRSELSHWPVQLMLAPPTAPFLRDREILLCADCVPFAVPDFHGKFLKDKAVLVGCPKLDDLNYYRDKLTALFAESGCTGVTVLTMEVPCCSGLNQAARQALQQSGKDISLKEIVISIRGEILREKQVAA